MKRSAIWISLAFGLMLGSIAAVGPTQAAPSRGDVPPILLNGENGILGLFVYLGPSMENTSIPMMGVMPVKVCEGSDCETYSANYLSDNEGYSLHRYINLQIDIGVRFGKRAVTAQVPADLVDGTKGWSATSNAVTGWTDSLEWFRSRSNRPVLEVQFGAIESTGVTRADLCANYREGQSLTRNISGFSAFDLVGYTAIKYVLAENGTQVKSEDLSASLSSMTSIPACGGGTMGSGLMKNIDGLSAGKSYKLMYTLSGTGKTDVTATLDFVTPGACPAGEIVLSPSPRAFYYGVLGTDGLLKSYLATGTFPWRLESVLGERIAPIYFSASKVGPYKGKLLNVRSSTEKWRYVREMDDWALVVDNATPLPASGVLAYTVFADCASASIKPTLSLDETNIKAADQACIVEANEVVPTKAGQCIVKAGFCQHRHDELRLRFGGHVQSCPCVNNTHIVGELHQGCIVRMLRGLVFSEENDNEDRSAEVCGVDQEKGSDSVSQGGFPLGQGMHGECIGVGSPCQGILQSDGPPRGQVKGCFQPIGDDLRQMT